MSEAAPASTVPASVVLGAVEALFGAGTSVAPMPGVGGEGATLLRYLPKLSDPWTNGLHLAAAPTPEQLGEALDTWEAFERPGRLRWVAPPGTGVRRDVRRVVDGRTRDGAPADLVVASRPAFHGVAAAPADVAAPTLGLHGDVEVFEPGTDEKAWAGFEVLARWIDLDEDPEVWRWRASRVRNLVHGRRGVAAIARVPAAPVGAAVLLRAPDHRPDTAPVAVVVVHQAHRGNGVAAALLAAVASAAEGPVTVLGDATGHLRSAAETLGLAHVADLVEVGARPEPADRKA